MPKGFRWWLLTGVVMTLIMVALGGITRLNEAGLSIVEWKPISGAIPPMNEKDWKKAFEQYKQIPQYRLIHAHITLSDFKRIYWLEFIHRQWGRLMGVVLLGGLLYFYFNGIAKGIWFWRLALLMFLGALQAFLGWLMVKSGFSWGPRVNPLMLMVHHLAALTLYSYLLWLSVKSGSWNFLQFRTSSKILYGFLFILLLQMLYGTLMAGFRIAPMAPTYPDFWGEYFPTSLWQPSLGIKNLIYNPTWINFVHRHLPWLLLLLTFYLKDYRLGLLVLVQMLLGIFTLIQSKVHVPVGFAVSHQVMAWLLWSYVLLWLWYRK